MNVRPLNSTHYAMLYPQNGDRILTTDSVTSLHPMYCRTKTSRALEVMIWTGPGASDDARLLSNTLATGPAAGYDSLAVARKYTSLE